MHFDYGYMEEGKLGKPYNIRLLRRLASYAVPYKKIISLSLFLSILITLMELSLPYLSKIAIDRYILSSWYQVDLSKMERTNLHDFIKEYGHLLERSENASYGLISHVKIKKIDPSFLHELRSNGIISQRRYYKIRPEAQGLSNFVNKEKYLLKMEIISIFQDLAGEVLVQNLLVI